MIVNECLQGSEEWFRARLGIPTASKFSMLLTKTGRASTQATGYMYRLLGEWLAGEPLQGDDYQSPAMARGYSLQPDALKFYEMERGVDVDEVGLVIAGKDGRPYSCSPDGLVGYKAGKLIGGVEIKCPLTKNHVETLMTGELPDEYKAQVQGSMLVCGTEWWDFTSYHPQLPSIVLRVQRDEDYIDSLSRCLDAFWDCLSEARDMLIERGFSPANGGPEK